MTTDMGHGFDERLELLASAHEIAMREGKSTNWLAFRNSVEKCLHSHNRSVFTARTYRATCPADGDSKP